MKPLQNLQVDFTIDVYIKLLESLAQAGYVFQAYRDFVQKPEERVILLRHDVDARKVHSLRFAKIQHELGIAGTYYFRMVPQSFDKEVIREIASMGHEIGYHYEDMDFAKGDVDKAYGLAKKHLAQLREMAEVKTICMHGSPRSPYDNKEVWKKYDYRELGIIAEPYFDLDFSKVLYLTDTGRRWDGAGVSLRDKVPVRETGSGRVGDLGAVRGRVGEGETGSGKGNARGREGEGESGKGRERGGVGEKVSGSDAASASRNVELLRGDKSASTVQRFDNSTNQPLSKIYSFRSTHEIIEACKADKLPNQIMMNFHPQRWTDNPFLWTQELVWQNVKNVVKAGVVRFRS